jgi:hypothetical protein
MTTPEVVRFGDGHYRCVIFGLRPYIADYEEQVLLSCIVHGVIFLGKDSSELNNGSPDNISSPPRMENYKLGKSSSPRRHNKQK